MSPEAPEGRESPEGHDPQGHDPGRHDSEPSGLDLPASLQADLRGRFGTVPEVSAIRERELLRQIRHGVLQNRPRVLVRWASRVAALVAVTFLLWAIPTRMAELPDPDLARYDVDGSGHLDILDAFRLALWLERGDSSPDRLPHDLNNDGRVDQRDVDLIARRAVALR